MSVEIDALVREGAETKAEMDNLQAKLRLINKQLADLAPFEGDKKTATIEAGGYTVKVQVKENVRWDQEKLNRARTTLGDDMFFKVFRWEYKPVSKKDLDGYLEYAGDEYKQPILDAMSTKPGAPSVTYTPKENK
jgi:hypothetical protein